MYVSFPFDLGQDHKGYSIQDNWVHTCWELHTATENFLTVPRPNRPIHVPAHQTHTHQIFRGTHRCGNTGQPGGEDIFLKLV